MGRFVLACVVAVGAALGSGARCGGAILSFDVTGIPSMDEFNAPANTVVNLNIASFLGLPIGSPCAMRGIGWDVVLFADPTVGMFGGSWFREIAVNFSDSAQAARVAFVPGGGDAFTGTAGPRPYSHAVGNLGSDLALPNGVLRVEFYELMDDEPNVADGRWVSGHLNILVVPAPNAACMLTAGGCILTMRRRRAMSPPTHIQRATTTFDSV